eukprot:PhF_6_TR5547/c0_g1_i2/m.7911
MYHLLAFFQLLLSRPYNAIVSPDDDYFVRTRKFILSGMFLMTPTNVFVAVPFMWQGETNGGYSTAVWVGTIMLCGGGVAFCSLPWFLVRSKICEVTDTFMEWWLLSLGIQTNVLILCMSTHGFDSLFFLWAFLNVQCHVKHLRWHMVFAFLGFCVFRYNATVYDVGLTSVELRLDGPLKAGKFEFLLSGMALSMWLLVTVGLFEVLNEYSGATQKANNTAMLCYAVSEKMMIYDV